MGTIRLGIGTGGTFTDIAVLEDDTGTVCIAKVPSRRCDPARIVEKLSEFIAAGVNYFVLAPIVPPDRRREHFERMANEVVPLLEKMESGKVT